MHWQRLSGLTRLPTIVKMYRDGGGTSHFVGIEQKQQHGLGLAIKAVKAAKAGLLARLTSES